MDPKLWPQVEELFEKAIDLPFEDRKSFVEAQYGHLPAPVCDEVKSLLENHDVTESPTSMLNPRLDSLVEEFAKKLSKEVGDSTTLLSGSREKLARQEDERRIKSRLAEAAPDFEILDTISRGGMGIVFKAHQKSLDRIVALKVLQTELIDDTIRRRFIRESQATAKVHHDHVVAIHAVHDSAKIPFLVMEFIDGPTLKRIINNKASAITPRQVATLVHQVALGLSAAHEQHLIHRDVKPSNIMVESLSNRGVVVGQTRAKLVDFGVVRDLEGDGNTLDQMVVGTPAYMSPEQLFDPTSVDHRSDIYGLGMTLYEMLTSELPYRGAPHMIMKQIDSSDPVEPRKLDDRIPRDLESICLKALHKTKERRYESASEFAADLQRFLDGEQTVARPITWREKATRTILRNPRMSLALGAVATLFLALLLGALVFAFTMKAKNNEILLARTETVDSRLETLLNARPGQLVSAIEGNLPLPNELEARLQSNFDSNEVSIMQKFNAAVALSSKSQKHTSFVIQCIPDLFESPELFRDVEYGLSNDPGSIELLRKAIDDEKDLLAKAKLILMLGHLGEFGPWREASKPSKDPSLRTEIIHLFGDWHGDLNVVMEQIRKRELEKEWIWTVCQAYALLDFRSLGQEGDKAIDFLKSCCETNPYANVVANAELALQRWKVDFDSPEPVTASNWFVTKNGIRMVKIEPTTVRLGRLDPLKEWPGWDPHLVTLSKSYYIADAEVTVDQFSEFAKYYKEKKPEYDWEWSDKVSPTGNHPAQQLSWYEAAQFCNWMSLKHGLKQVYSEEEEMLEIEIEGNEKFRIRNYEIDHEANGFRMPYEAEWEHACRAGSETLYYFGDQKKLFPLYGASSNDTLLASSPVRQHLPNPFGLFDTLGNVWEWNNDWRGAKGGVATVDPIGPETYSTEIFGRVHRGGSVGNARGEIDADARGTESPASIFFNVGFRIAVPVRPLQSGPQTTKR